MKLPEDVGKSLARIYRTQHKTWLRDSPDRNCWPLELPLGMPTERQAARQLDAVNAWIAAWQSWTGRGILEWSERHWRFLGTHKLPLKLSLHCPEEVAAWVGEQARWGRASSRWADMVATWPDLGHVLSRHFDVFADYVEADYERLKSFLSWIKANPSSGLYVRQVPVGGLDTKWIENRKGLLCEFVKELHPERSAVSDFFQCCGLRQPPAMIRLRLLDPMLRNRLDGLGDFAAPVESIAGLHLRPSRVYIVENLQTGLAFDDLPGSVVVMRLGYNVDVLRLIPWLGKADCVYWGDIDTHGFAILSLARTILPNLRSILMDEHTLMGHQELWVTEREQYPGELLPALTPEEQRVYIGLKRQHWGMNIRLEQERIAWKYAWDQVQNRASS